MYLELVKSLNSFCGYVEEKEDDDLWRIILYTNESNGLVEEIKQSTDNRFTKTGEFNTWELDVPSYLVYVEFDPDKKEILDAVFYNKTDNTKPIKMCSDVIYFVAGVFMDSVIKEILK